jgi:hypothetical protein
MSFFTDIIILLNTITLEIGEVISDVEGAYADFIDTLTLTETLAFYIADYRHRWNRYPVIYEFKDGH